MMSNRARPNNFRLSYNKIMGLDVVELVMRVEEEFEIRIEDEEASLLNTAGQIHTLILSKTGLLNENRCQSSATFYQLRRALVDIAATPRRAMRPTTAVGELLPVAKRRQQWKSWSEAAKVELPALEKPKWMQIAVPLFFAAIIGAGFYEWNTSSSAVFWPYAFALVALYKAHQWSEIRAVNLPADCATMGGLTKAVMKLNYGINTEPREPQTSEEIWERLKAIVVDETGVAPDEVTREARFIRDLNFG